MSEGLSEALERIRTAEAGPEGLNAFTALADAAQSGPGAADAGGAADTAGPAGHRTTGEGPLADALVAVKDNIATATMPTTCGSRLLDGYVSPFEATAVRKVREAGGTIIGVTNMDEFGMGSSTEHSAWGATLNPLDRERVPGGSSGGSAAAVAAGYVRMALGSDTGGSVRQPAAFCGVVGIKPTYGRVSRYGLVSYASSLDQIGALGSTVHDAATLLAAVSGHDPRDATSVQAPAWAVEDEVAESLDGTVIGVPDEYMTEGIDRGVREAVERAADTMRGLGAEIRRVSLPHTELAIPAYYVLAPSEASSNLSRYDGVRFGRRVAADDVDGMYRASRSAGFGTEVKRRILLGTYALSAGYYDAYYGAAQRARARIAADFRTAFSEGVDLLLTPTTPGPAFRLGERIDDPLTMYLSDVFTVTANLAGLPAMSLPVGTSDGMPVGGQLIAPWWGEGKMVRVARVLEAALRAGPGASA